MYSSFGFGLLENSTFTTKFTTTLTKFLFVGFYYYALLHLCPLVIPTLSNFGGGGGGGFGVQMRCDQRAQRTKLNRMVRSSCGLDHLLPAIIKDYTPA